MITSVPGLVSYTTEAKSTTNPTWKLGDIMPGKVVSSGKGSSIVSIEGNNYWLNSSLKFAQGESLMLKVAGLNPMVHFSLVNRVRENVRNGEVVSAGLREKILQNLAAPDRNLNNSVSSLISLLHFGPTQSLPPATLQLLDAMRRRLLKASGLGNPSLIRHSVLNGSIVNDGSPAANAARNGEHGLQSLLHQIIDSLAIHRAIANRLPGLANYQNAIGIAQYQSNEGELLRSFTQNAEEQYLNLTNAKTRSSAELPLPPYRLSVELPVVFKDHISSITIRFQHGKGGTKEDTQGGKEDAQDKHCSAEFEFELPACGSVFTQIVIANASVSYLVGCERERVAFHLAQRQKAMEDALHVYGLNLDVFRCEVSEGHLSADDSNCSESDPKPRENSSDSIEPTDLASADAELRQRMHDAHDEGKIPELKEFVLQVKEQPVALETEIPVELYCAMASFFVQLLEIENA